MKKAVCLLSGGLDSTTALYDTLAKGYSVTAVTVHYGQLHSKEIEYAKRTAEKLALDHHLITFSMPWKGSSLLDKNMPVPLGREEKQMGQDIPSTYVPARNSIFLCFAASCAEAVGAESLVIGANILDYSGYPDCRPEFFESFERTIALGTKAGSEGKNLRILAPLLHLNKKEIIQLGQKLKVPFEQTWSCYQGQDRPCGQCDSCRLRAKGFQEAGFIDPGSVIASAAKSAKKRSRSAELFGGQSEFKKQIASSPAAPRNDGSNKGAGAE